MPPQKHNFLFYQPKWRGRKIVRHFVAAVAIGSVTLTLSYWFKKTDQGWTRDTVINRKHISGPTDLITVASVVFLTVSGNFTVPADFNSANNTIEAIGGGGGGVGATGSLTSNAGGAGGHYAKIFNLSLTPGSSVPFIIGAGGVGTASNLPAGAGGTTSFQNTSTLAAAGGAGGVSGVATPSTGNGDADVGSVVFSGGGAILRVTTGGGGAAGPNGNGIGGTGGAGAGDNHFGGAGGAAGQPGFPGTEFTQTSDGTKAGSGGAGGGGGSTAGGNGGNYGGGGGGGGGSAFAGGSGAPGIIVITSTPPVILPIVIPWDTSFLTSRNFSVVSY